MKICVVVLALLSALFTVESQASLPGRVRSANEVVINRMTSQQPIPAFVIDAARCIAALKVVKAGLIWGGQGSTGMVSCRTQDGQWSEPSFFSVSGVNFGLQIGVQFLESVLVVISDEARKVLDHATFQLGTDLSIAAGPVGAGGGVGVLPNAQVLTYDRAVGLYAGATVNGFVLAHDRPSNQRAYGAEIEPAVLLSTNGDEAPALMTPFVQTLNRYFP